MAAHCFMYEFTDLGWRELGDDGVAPLRKPGFVWHTGPGCVLLPEDTKICFLRCDTVSCMMGEVRVQIFSTLLYAVANNCADILGQVHSRASYGLEQLHNSQDLRPPGIQEEDKDMDT